jgi:hypothetical protein
MIIKGTVSGGIKIKRYWGGGHFIEFIVIARGVRAWEGEVKKNTLFCCRETGLPPASLLAKPGSRGDGQYGRVQVAFSR